MGAAFHGALAGVPAAPYESLPQPAPAAFGAFRPTLSNAYRWFPYPYPYENHPALLACHLADSQYHVRKHRLSKPSDQRPCRGECGHKSTPKGEALVSTRASRIMSVMKARQLVDQLSLSPHPEGGWYREIYRSRERVQTRRGLRSALTTIHYLLEQQQLSRWHVVESAEIWHFYDGAPLELFEYVPTTRHLARHVLGDVREGNESVVVIEAGVWQAARSRGEFSLVGCTVGPGFEFEDFRFVAALSGHQAHFAGELEELAHLL